MPDREKVIERLTGLKELLKFQKDILGYGSFIEDINDALALLKETAVPVTASDEMGCTWYYVCPECKFSVDYKDDYCRYCGRKLNWAGM